MLFDLFFVESPIILFASIIWYLKIYQNVKNAFVHNIDGGHIRITVTKNSITFRNSGVENPLDKEHIFERFYQGTKKEGSTGLGLAIADSICRLQHLSIRYYFEQKEHCFEISRQ